MGFIYFACWVSNHDWEAVDKHAIKMQIEQVEWERERERERELERRRDRERKWDRDVEREINEQREWDEVTGHTEEWRGERSS